MRYTNRIKQTVADPSPAGEGGEIALDIEAINIVEKPDLNFDDASHWSVFCVSLAHRPEGSNAVDTRVLWRQGPTVCDELELIDRVTDWIRDRSPELLLTYNGKSYDLPILRHRASVTSKECPGSHVVEADLDMLLDSIRHEDLFPSVRERYNRNVSLESALKDNGIETPTVELDGREVSGEDMPVLGLRILRDEATDEELKAVAEYAKSDVKQLVTLRDSLSE